MAKDNYTTSFTWITSAHITGFAIFGLSHVQPNTVVTWFRWGLFVYFLLASIEVVLTRSHHHNLPLVPPATKRYALITGASTGLGREIAYILADRKYSLILASGRDSLLERMQREITLVHKGVDVQCCICDLGTHQGINKLLEYVNENKLVVDVLVNGAVDGEDPHLFQELTNDEVGGLVNLNVVAMTRITHAMVEQMKNRGMGRVLNLSTLAAHVSAPTAAIYGASKAFITSFSHALHYELRDTGVTVTCFHSGTLEYTGTELKHRKLGQLWPWVVYPKDAAAYAVDALFRADESAYDAYLNQIWSFILYGWFPQRLGQMIVAMARQNSFANACNLIRRKNKTDLQY